MSYHFNLIHRTCFEQGAPWHLGNYKNLQYVGGWDSYQKKNKPDTIYFFVNIIFCRSKLVLVIIIFSTSNEVNKLMNVVENIYHTRWIVFSI